MRVRFPVGAQIGVPGARAVEKRRKEIEDKFLLNARHGGYDAARAKAALDLAGNVFGSRIDLSLLRG